MFVKNIMWTSFLSAALTVAAHDSIVNPVIACDTLEYSISPVLLDDITVRASGVVRKPDGRVLHPDEEIIRTATDGIDMLRKMQLPRVSVNPLTNEINIVGGGTIMLHINGVEATAAQVSALNPHDILRLELQDAPGVEYAGAAMVIDYITSRVDSGGSVAVDAFGAFASGRWASIDHFSAAYNKGCSAWNVNVGYMGQRKDKWVRDYEECWNYPEGPVIRREMGLPVTVGGSGLESVVNYNYLHPGGHMLNIRAGLDFNYVPNQEEGDRRGLLSISDGDEVVSVYEHTEEKSVRPNLGVYYLHKFSGVNSLTFEGHSAYLASHFLHQYMEDLVGEESRVRGDKYTLNVAALFEHRIGHRAVNAVISHDRGWLVNKYSLAGNGVVRIDDSKSSLAGEYSDRFGPWAIRGSLKLTHSRLSQNAYKIARVFLLPSFWLSYRPGQQWQFRYGASIDYRMPPAAAISDIEQPIQTGLVRRGNPHLKPFRVIDQRLSASFDCSYVDVEAMLDYSDEHSPVMESVIFDDGVFVRTFFNQRSFRRLIASASVAVHLWDNHISLTAEPVLTRYFSRGNGYSHSHSIFRLGLGLDFSYGNWLAYGNIMSGPANKMYGEEIIEEKDMNMIMVGYKRENWSVHAGVFNAFMKNYWMETRYLSALTPYKSKAHSDRGSSYLSLKFTWRFDFGRKGRYVDTMGRDIETDPGILRGNK